MTSSPASMVPALPFSRPSKRSVISACRFWLTLAITRRSCASGWESMLASTTGAANPIGGLPFWFSPSPPRPLDAVVVTEMVLSPAISVWCARVRP